MNADLSAFPPAVMPRLRDAWPVGEVVAEHVSELRERGPLRFLEHVQERASLVDVQREQRDAPVEAAGDAGGERPGGLVALDERRDDPSQVVIGPRDTEEPHRGERTRGCGGGRRARARRIPPESCGSYRPALPVPARFRGGTGGSTVS